MLYGIGINLPERILKSRFQHQLTYGQIQSAPPFEDPLGVLGPIQMRRTIEITAQQHGDRLIEVPFILQAVSYTHLTLPTKVRV